MVQLMDVKSTCDKLKISRSKLLRTVDEGTFPPPVKVNGRCVWMEDEIDLMVKTMISGMSIDGIKKTIAEILNRRQFYREVYDEK